MNITLLPEWSDPTDECENCETMEFTVFADDGECECGVHKHHYHCSVCGKIVQVG